MIFVFILFALRIFLSATIGLVDDETYHWGWTKDLQLSYFDHPGMIAWSQWLSTSLFGDGKFAIRIPALLYFAGTLYFIFKTALDVFGRSTALLIIILMFFIPLWGVAGFVSTPDLPLAFFATSAVYFFWQSIRNDEKQWSVKKAWLLVGISMGLGMNSKFTICLLGLGMGLFLLLTPRVRKHLLTPWPWIGALVCFLLMSPVFIWNQQNGWPGFIYQFYQRHQGGQLDFQRWLGFWGYQWIFMSPGIYFLMLLTVVACFKKWSDERWRFLICVPLPSLVLFYYQPLFSSDFKPHWPSPSYMVLIIATAQLWIEGLRVARVNVLKPKSKVAAGFVLFFLIILNVVTYVPLTYPVIPKIYAAFNNPADWVPKWDFSNEFFGWDEAGEYILKRQSEVEQQAGTKPFLASHRYELVSRVRYHTGTKTWKIGQDVDQFLFDQPISEREKLKGQSALVIGHDKYPNPGVIDQLHFDSCEKEEFKTYRSGIHSRTFYIWYCKNFHGNG